MSRRAIKAYSRRSHRDAEAFNTAGSLSAEARHPHAITEQLQGPRAQPAASLASRI